MKAQAAHAAYVEQLRLGAASKADEEAAAAVTAATRREAAKEVAAAVAVYLIFAALGYAFWVLG